MQLVLALPRRLPGRAAFVAGILSLSAGAFLFAEQGWVRVKAELAERLIDRAFARHLADGEAHPPWRWADTSPIARLEVPRLGVRRVVLAGATGAVLAFGPGHIHGTALPNQVGNCAIGGHRDSWFRFLGQLRPGDELWLTTREGRRRYRVERLGVHDRRDTTVLEPGDARRLTLITCHPIDGILPTRERYVVTLREADAPDGASTYAETDGHRAGPG